MPLGIAYWFYGFVDASRHRVLGTGYLVSLPLANPSSLDLQQLAHWRGIAIRDHGELRSIRMVLDCLSSLGIMFR